MVLFPIDIDIISIPVDFPITCIASPLVVLYLFQYDTFFHTILLPYRTPAPFPLTCVGSPLAVLDVSVGVHVGRGDLQRRMDTLEG